MSEITHHRLLRFLGRDRQEHQAQDSKLFEAAHGSRLQMQLAGQNFNATRSGLPRLLV